MKLVTYGDQCGYCDGTDTVAVTFGEVDPVTYFACYECKFASETHYSFLAIRHVDTTIAKVESMANC